MAFSAQPILSIIFLFTIAYKFIYRTISQERLNKISLVLLSFLIYVLMNGIFQESINFSDIFSLSFLNNEGRIFLAYIPFLYFLNYKKEVKIHEIRKIIYFIFFTLLLITVVNVVGIKTFSSHHYVGTFYSFMFVLFGSILIYHSKIRIPIILTVVAILISVFGLLMSGSRGALLGIFPAMLFLLFFLDFKYKFLFLFLISLVLSTLLLGFEGGAYGVSFPIFQKLLTVMELFDYRTLTMLYEQSIVPIDKKPLGGLTGEEEISGIWNIIQRFRYWYISLILFSEAPFFGIGLGGFDNFPHKIMLGDFGTYVETFGYTSSVVTPHNGFLTILVEQGLVGFFVIAYVFFMLIYKALEKVFSSTYSYAKLMNISFIAYFIVFIFHSLTNSTFNAPGHLIPLSLMFFLANSFEVVDED